MTRIFHWFFLCERWIPCHALTSVLCLHDRPETVNCSTKDAYTSEITFLALHPCLAVSFMYNFLTMLCTHTFSQYLETNCICKQHYDFKKFAYCFFLFKRYPQNLRSSLYFNFLNCETSHHHPRKGWKISSFQNPEKKSW